jgi:hypothetical protein
MEEKLFDEVKASLVEDGIGYRLYSLDIDSQGYGLEINKQVDGNWKWRAYLQDGEQAYSFPVKLKEFADSICKHFNVNATV